MCYKLFPVKTWRNCALRLILCNMRLEWRKFYGYRSCSQISNPLKHPLPPPLQISYLRSLFNPLKNKARNLWGFTSRLPTSTPSNPQDSHNKHPASPCLDKPPGPQLFQHAYLRSTKYATPQTTKIQRHGWTSEQRLCDKTRKQMGRVNTECKHTVRNSACGKLTYRTE